MKLTREILKHLENQYKDINYYYSIIEIIEINLEINPDISIESCKSLFEGLSKFILKHLDYNYDNKVIDNLDVHPLFKKSLRKISEYNDFMEEDFINRAAPIVHLLGEIRTKRGDISHGKLSPKTKTSDALFSQLAMQITDSIISYILYCFAEIEIQQDLKFEDNSNFNDWLDEENNFGPLRYSRALFDQDIENSRRCFHRSIHESN